MSRPNGSKTDKKKNKKRLLLWQCPLKTATFPSEQESNGNFGKWNKDTVEMFQELW